MPRKLVTLVLAALLVAPAHAVAQGNRIMSALLSPGPENVLPIARPVLITGIARTNSEESVAAVELQISDDPGSWHPAARRDLPETTWSLVHTFTIPGRVSVTVRARTATQPQTLRPMVETFWIGGGGPLPKAYAYSQPALYERGDTTENPVDDDPRPVELGLRFQVDRPGKVLKILSTNNFTIEPDAGVYRYWDDGSSGVPSQTYAHSAYSVLPLFYS
ncbi:DUF4082 domain-containing protein [Actinokineospora globicatena]|uniref:DUF4082 domain-containing protein n=1 Tax=Actinokineospora globicatena TaxID=103729 RepID=UPI0020A41DB7|nr:DUF4082 domain-containing protein [Actinokineospora globicatena]MCP2301820.1 hypothetical protein [Actinokineospora globicatena]GLW76522.1 hypothetical protein Aglo01_10040 [Actinokineospora globicatena]GLW83357.1 hypothetical protein Aglo02_09970 [Actinokineospora globicatena]